MSQTQLIEVLEVAMALTPGVDETMAAEVIDLANKRRAQIDELRSRVLELPSRKKPTNKPYNVECDPADVDKVTRIVMCPEETCHRALVNYGLHVRESRHNRGLAPEIIELVRATGRPVVEMACNHHGSEDYKLPPVK